MRTPLLALGWTLLLTLVAAAVPATEPGNACGPASHVTGGTAAGGPEGSLHRRLVDLDRQLRRNLTGVVRHADRLDAARLENDVESLRGALRDLERRAHGLEGSAAATRVRKVRQLGGLLHNLERATVGADPAGALPGHGGRSGEVLRVPQPVHLTPDNDDCADAFDLEPGQTAAGDTSDATQDGQASCGVSLFSNDVWFKVTAGESGYLFADTFGSEYDTVLSVHSGCQGTLDNQIHCNDDTFGLASAVSFWVTEGQEYWIRLSGFDQDAGSYELHLGFGGEISGTVTSAENGDPLADGWVRLWTSDGYYAGSASTGETGDYALGVLEPDGYFLSTRDFEGFFDELYDDLPCPGGSCEVAAGTAVEVASHAAVADVDFALEQGGTIAGTVTATATGEPIAGVEIEIWDQEADDHVGYAVTDEQGDYRVGGLVAGTYFASADSWAHRDELYDDLPCPGDIPWDCDPTTGTPTAVEEGLTTAGIDFALDRLGAIAGTVTETLTGDPIDGLRVEIRRQNGSWVGSAYSGASGEYLLGGLLPDTYVASTDSYRYADELYDDVPCPDGLPYGCDAEDGTPITVELNATAEGVDFALDRLGVIAGTVTDAATGEPIPGVRVEAHPAEGWPEDDTTDSAGEYRIEYLPPEAYLMTAEHFQFVDELYDDVPCPGGLPDGCQPEDGTAVAVERNATAEGVDFGLQRLGSIAGTVVDAASGQPLEDVRVIVWDGDGSSVRMATTDAAGSYEAVGLDAGTYFATTDDEVYLDELYDDLPCFDGCDPAAGTPIAVSVGATTGGIDFALDPGGVIAGTVTDAVTGHPISADVEIWAADGSWVDDDYSSGGQYAVEGLSPGTYFATAYKYSSYLRKLYDDIPCPPGCDPTAGTPIAVTAGATTADIDFTLDRLGVVAGTVIDAASGEPIYDAWVKLWNAAGTRITYEWTNGAGDYWFYDLYPGTYFVTVQKYTYVDELYDGIHCPRSGCEPTAGTPVAVELNATTEGIDFALEHLGAISATVVDTETGEPLESIEVEIWTGDGAQAGSCATDSGGSCTVAWLYPETHYAVTDNGQGYLDELYDGLPCFGGPRQGCDPTKGTPIAVTVAATVEIGFTLMFFDSGIAGRVTAEGGEPFAGVVLDAWDGGGGHVDSTTSLSTGEYFLRLDPGTYTVSTDNEAGYMDEIYPDVSCPQGSAADGLCDPLLGLAITVSDSGAQMIVTGIDFDLVAAGALIFRDGFESGDLSAWE